MSSRFLGRRRISIGDGGLCRGGREVEVDVQLAVHLESDAAVAHLVVAQHVHDAQRLLVARGAEALHHDRVLHDAVVGHLVGNGHHPLDPLIHSVLRVLQVGVHELAQGLRPAGIQGLLQKFLFLFLLLVHVVPKMKWRKYTFFGHGAPTNDASECRN